MIGGERSIPSLSVVLPVYNQQRYVRAAINSILTQTYRDFELLVVDDGSTDETPRIVASIDDSRLRLIRNPHNGFIAALKTGIEAARAPWIARMDSDDLSARRRFELQMDFVEKNCDCVFVGSVFGIVTPNDRFLDPVDRFEARFLTADDISMARVSFADPSAVFSRQVALECGLYDSDFPGNEKPLWYKMLSKGRGAVIGQPLHYVRWRLGSLSRTNLSKGWLDNRSIRERYDPESLKALSQKRFPGGERASMSATVRCHDYYLLARDFDAAREVVRGALRQAPASGAVWKMFLKSTLRRRHFRGTKARYDVPYTPINHQPVQL